MDSALLLILTGPIVDIILLLTTRNNQIKFKTSYHSVEDLTTFYSTNINKVYSPKSIILVDKNKKNSFHCKRLGVDRW